MTRRRPLTWNQLNDELREALELLQTIAGQLPVETGRAPEVDPDEAVLAEMPRHVLEQVHALLSRHPAVDPIARFERTARAYQNRFLLRLTGHVPSSKNRRELRPVRGSREIVSRPNAAARAAMDGLQFQAQAQWTQGGPGRPVRHPQLIITYYVRDARADRDNKTNALLDVLTKAGVLENDNIAQLNGPLLIQPAVVREPEGADVLLLWPTFPQP